MHVPALDPAHSHSGSFLDGVTKERFSVGTGPTGRSVVRRLAGPMTRARMKPRTRPPAVNSERPSRISRSHRDVAGRRSGPRLISEHQGKDDGISTFRMRQSGSF